jgi:hypothetical protein
MPQPLTTNTKAFSSQKGAYSSGTRGTCSTYNCDRVIIYVAPQGDSSWCEHLSRANYVQPRAFYERWSSKSCGSRPKCSCLRLWKSAWPTEQIHVGLIPQRTQRICPGRWFFMQSLFITAATVLSVFDIKAPVDQDGHSRKLEVRMMKGLISCVNVYFTPGKCHQFHFVDIQNLSNAL